MHDMPRLIVVVLLAVLLGGASCSTGVSSGSAPTPASSGASPTPSPLPRQVVNWKSYSSAEYGYSLRYPPHWLDLGSLGGPGYAHYFSNEKTDNGSLLQMSPSGLTAGVDANCQSDPGGRIRLISRAEIIVGDVPTIRYVIERSSDVTPPATYAIATVKRGAFCYRIEMEALTLLTLQPNLADFDLMLASVRFSTRKAPAVTPLPTTPPT